MKCEYCISSEFPLRFATVYLGTIWPVAWLVDFSGYYESERLPFWFLIFSEGSPTEWFQWFFLGGCVISAAFLWGKAFSIRRLDAVFWMLLSIGFLLMLIEDSGNLRHRIGDAMVVLLLPEQNYYTRLAKNGFEIVYYSIVASFIITPLYFLVRRGHPSMIKVGGGGLLGAGCAFYFIAAVASATSYIGDWYAVAGGAILEFLIVGEEVAWWSGSGIELSGDYPYNEWGFWFMDSAFEESIELAGAACLLTYLVRLARYRE